ncbi:MAG: hypothetical protein RL661_77, partial [Pseudomonadota bacterium]
AAEPAKEAKPEPTPDGSPVSESEPALPVAAPSPALPEAKPIDDSGERL